MSEAIPEKWFLEEHKPLVIGWLLILKVPPKVKKWALWEWCKEHSIELVGRDIVKVTGLPAGEV